MSKTEIIKARNKLFIKIREFFYYRGVQEVDTSLVRKYSVTDPYMSALKVTNSKGDFVGFLQTSPEYAMKELLSLGSGDIFQLSKMFRADEQGSIHSKEFTMLEWYRVGFNHLDLIQEVCDFIEKIIGDRKVKIFCYRDAFLDLLSIDPFCISLGELRSFTEKVLGDIPKDLLFDNYLTLLFTEKIEPSFNPKEITVIKDYPESQASLAKTRKHNGIVTADRFEVYCGGLELANGFNELTDADEQLNRFEQDNKIRRTSGLNEIPVDSDFINALKRGIPDCAGVALGVDRLLMIKLQKENIIDVIL